VRRHYRRSEALLVLEDRLNRYLFRPYNLVEVDRHRYRQTMLNWNLKSHSLLRRRQGDKLSKAIKEK